MKRKTNYAKIKKALSGTTQQITNVVQQQKPLKYVVTECINVLRNMWAEPKYTELIITPNAWYKLVAFINLVGDYEISGFGRIQEYTDENNKTVQLVTDFDIIKQEVKAAYVESDEDAVLQFIMKLPADQRNEWTLDWHSHVNMCTSPSGTDWNNYSEMLKARMGKQFPSMIVNKKGEITAQQIMSETKHPEIKMFVQQQALSEPEIVAIYEECKEKVENLCTKAVVQQSSTKSKNFNNWAGYRNQRYNNYGYNTKRWWEEDEWEDELNTGTATGAIEYAADELDDCQYCGAPASAWHTNQMGVGICKECYDDLTH